MSRFGITILFLENHVTKFDNGDKYVDEVDNNIISRFCLGNDYCDNISLAGDDFDNFETWFRIFW